MQILLSEFIYCADTDADICGNLHPFAPLIISYIEYIIKISTMKQIRSAKSCFCRHIRLQSITWFCGQFLQSQCEWACDYSIGTLQPILGEMLLLPIFGSQFLQVDLICRYWGIWSWYSCWDSSNVNWTQSRTMRQTICCLSLGQSWMFEPQLNPIISHILHNWFAQSFGCHLWNHLYLSCFWT